VTLDQAPAGVPVHVTGADLDAALVRRLAELGVRAGRTVTPLHGTSGGGRVVAVDDTRVALARAVLRRIEVVAT
jgi:Fe2+ transport system protein FeoA